MSQDKPPELVPEASPASIPEAPPEPPQEPPRPWRWWLLGALVVGLVMVFAVPALYREVRTWRGGQLAEEASRLFEEERQMGAWEKVRAARALAPADLMVTRTAAEIAQSLDPRVAVPLWEQVVVLSEGAREDRRALARVAVRTGQLPLAEEQVAALRELPVEPEDLVIEATLRQREQRFEEAMEVADELLAHPGVRPLDELFYVQLTQLHPEVEVQLAGLARLWGLLEREDDLALTAVGSLAQLPQGRADLERLIARLESAAELDRSQQLLRLSLLWRLPETEGVVIASAAGALFDLNRPEDRTELGQWLNGQGLFEASLRLVSEEQAKERRDWLLIHLDALARTGQWVQAEAILRSPRLPLEEPLRELFLMRSWLAREDARRAGLAWDRALAAAGMDLETLWTLAQYALRLGLNDFARGALERLARRPEGMQVAYGVLLELARQERDTVRLRELYERMRREFPADQAIRNDYAYLRLLLDREVEDARAEAEALVESDPRFLAFKVTLALGMLRSDEAERGARLLAGVPVNWREMPAPWRAVLAGCLHGFGQTKMAERVGEGIDPGTLLAEEAALLDASGVVSSIPQE